MDKMWKVAGESRNPHKGTNASTNMNDWSHVELQNFVKWFIEVNHPEAVEQYQAIRAIERKVEEAEVIEAERRMNELRRQHLMNQMAQIQNSYSPGAWGAVGNPESPKGNPESPKKSFWERCKEVALRHKQHGDYY